VIEAVRPMSAAEVHLLWAALRPGTAEADIEAALRLAPDSPAALRTRAHLFERAGSLAAAQEALEKARALSPEDPHVLFDLFRTYAQRASLRGASPVFRERAEALAPKVFPTATSAYAQQGIAASLFAWGRRDEAMPFALRAIETNRSCWRWYDTLASLLFDRGEPANAVKAQEIALHAMPEETGGDVSHAAYQRLRRYRAAAKTLFSDAVIRIIVKHRVDAYERCYADGLARDPRLEGRVVARFVVQPDGAPANVTDDGSTLPDKQVVACVLAEIAALRFPPRDGGAPQKVTHPLTFSPPSASGAGQPAP
jgi:tetratricopeptide (TPR) repeat protein